MKKILTTFIIGCIGLISFGYCFNYNSFNIISNGTFRATVGNSTINYDLSAGNVLFFWGEFGTKLSCSLSGTNLTTQANSSIGYYIINTGQDSINLVFNCSNSFTSYKNINHFEFDITSFSSSCPTCPECEECQECPTIDSQYCQENNLCPSSGTGSDCPVYTGDINWSILYINDIQHEGAGTINITIPEEFSWDYTNENDVFDLDIEGYNVDTEYIDGIIRTQNYQPTTEDLTNIFSNFGYFGGLLVACLFVILVFYMIKKIFS